MTMCVSLLGGVSLRIRRSAVHSLGLSLQCVRCCCYSVIFTQLFFVPLCSCPSPLPLLCSPLGQPLIVTMNHTVCCSCACANMVGACHVCLPVMRSIFEFFVTCRFTSDISIPARCFALSLCWSVSSTSLEFDHLIAVEFLSPEKQNRVVGCLRQRIDRSSTGISLDYLRRFIWCACCRASGAQSFVSADA